MYVSFDLFHRAIGLVTTRIVRKEEALKPKWHRRVVVRVHLAYRPSIPLKSLHQLLGPINKQMEAFQNGYRLAAFFCFSFHLFPIFDVKPLNFNEVDHLILLGIPKR